jgi:hypothetical protein
MIFFTTFVTLIRRQIGGTERRLGSPARVEGTTLRLPIGTDVQIGDYVEHCPPHNELRTMTVIDVIHPHMPAARAVDDHIEVTCGPRERVPIPEVTTPSLHPMMSAPLALMKDGRMSEAAFEALRLVKERVQSLTEVTIPGTLRWNRCLTCGHRNSTAPRQLAPRLKKSVKVSGSCSSVPCSGYQSRTVPWERRLPRWTRRWST